MSGFLHQLPPTAYKRIVYTVVAVVVLSLAAGFWYQYDRLAVEETDKAVSYEPFFTQEGENRYLYFSGKQSGEGPGFDVAALNLYAYDLLEDEVVPVSSDGSLYNLKIDRYNRHLIAFGPYHQHIDETIATPEVPFWFDLKERVYDNMTIPWGFYKHSLEAGYDLIAYQQHITGDLQTEDDLFATQNWETVIYNSVTDNHWHVPGKIQPQFLEDDSALLLLAADGIHLYDTERGETVRHFPLDIYVDPFSQLAMAPDLQHLVISSSQGHQVYRVSDTNSSNGQSETAERYGPFATGELQLQYQTDGWYGSVIIDEGAGVYYIVNNELSAQSDEGIIIQQRDLASGEVLDLLTVPHFFIDNFTIDMLHPTLVIDELL